jgi:OmpA-OmpF porin, OOP family
MKKQFLFALCSLSLIQSVHAVDFPDKERSRRNIEVINTFTLKQLTIGMTRRQVYSLLGTPHFNEGLGVKVWNYLFNIHDTGRALAKDCQLQLRYEKGRLVAFDWNKEECAKTAR